MIRMLPLPGLDDLNRRGAIFRQWHIVRETDAAPQHEAAENDEGHDGPGTVNSGVDCHRVQRLCDGLYSMLPTSLSPEACANSGRMIVQSPVVWSPGGLADPGETYSTGATLTNRLPERSVQLKAIGVANRVFL
jgi:hypothetical protein